MNLDADLLADIADDAFDALAIIGEGLPKLVEEQRLVFCWAERAPLTAHLDHVTMQLGKKAATEVDVAWHVAFRQHAMTIERIETNQNIALSPAVLVGIGYVG
ncbi:hypothetical protein [Aeromonas sp.]|uniref:hypothetical protein n=1 Tax=Aeromonas sp. TaxID=647 RepID=UPI00258809FC|nr:hypothetical protein [Aeromonas sp.]